MIRRRLLFGVEFVRMPGTKTRAGSWRCEKCTGKVRDGHLREHARRHAKKAKRRAA